MQISDETPFANSNTYFTFNTVKPTRLLTFYGENQQELAIVYANGDVQMDANNANTVAKLFWENLHLKRPHCPNCNSAMHLV